MVGSVICVIRVTRLPAEATHKQETYIRIPVTLRSGQSDVLVNRVIATEEDDASS